MKILQVTPSFWPNRGGVETHVGEVSRQLLMLHHQVNVLTEINDRLVIRQLSLTSLNRLSKSPVKFRQLPPTQFLAKLFYKLKIWQQIWQCRHDFSTAEVIQVHDVGWWMAPVYFFTYSKFFITFHGWEGKWPIPQSIKWQRLLISKLARGRIHVGGWIQDFYGDQPDWVTYGAVNLIGKGSVGAQSAKTKQSLTLARRLSPATVNHPLTIGFLGRLEPENEIAKYCQLVDQLRLHGIKTTMIWIGAGRLSPICRQRGRVTGWTNQPHRYLKSVDVVAASSYLSILQAQALGKRVLSFYSSDLKKAYLLSYPGRKGLIISNRVDDLVKFIQKFRSRPYLARSLDPLTWQWVTDQTWASLTKTYLGWWQSKL